MKSRTFSTIVKVSYFNSGAVNLPIESKRMLGEGQVVFLAGPDETPVFTGMLSKSKNFNKPVYCQGLYNETHPLLPELPLQVGDKLIFDIKDGKVRILSIVKGVWKPGEATSRYEPKAQPDNADQAPPPKLPPDPDYSDLLKAIVQWIQDDPFQRSYRQGKHILPRGNAPRGNGWDFRLREFAYTRSWLPAFPRVHQTTAPVRQQMRKLREKYDWGEIQEDSQISKKDLKQLDDAARWIFDWGEAPQKPGFSSGAWLVFAGAVTGVPSSEAPLNGSWSKFASFASEGLPHELPVWDSRVSSSVIHRIDRILTANGLTPDDFPNLVHLRILLANGGTRPRPLHFQWRSGFPQANDSAWAHYFAIAEILRQMLATLNDPENQFPRMPLPDGGSGDWDMFDLNLVLFMDGY